MKNKVFEINVDFETKSAVDSDLIKIVKGDYNSIEFDLKMDKTDYKRAVLFLVKPSKKNFVVDIANSKAIFTEKNTFDEVGIYYYGIVLYGTNSKLTTSTKGKIQVVEGYNEDNEDITGDENYPILDNLIEEVTDLKDKINASLGVMNKTFKEVTYDPSTGVMSFKNLNNEVTNINLPLSLLISSASYDNDNKKIVLTLANNDTIDIPVLDLVSNYYDDKINANKKQIASTSNELYRLKTDVLETGENTDTFVHLEDSAIAEMQELEVEGVCEQETTEGKNLFNKDLFNKFIAEIQTIELTLKPNTYYTMSSNLPLFNGNANIFFKLPNESFDSVINGITPIRPKMLLTDEKGIVNIGYRNTSNALTGDLKNDYFYMLNEGTTALDYEPYTGEQPSPSSDYPQEIKTITGSLKLTSCGKNLFDKDNVVDGYRIDNNGLPFNDPNSVLSQYVKVKPNTTYYTNFQLIWSNRICEYTKDKIFILSNQSKLNEFTTSNNCEYIRITCLKTQKGELQLEQGSAATPYEEHLETQITANLPENEFIGKINDTYKDTLKVKYNQDDGQYHLILNKMVCKVVLDGSENIIIINSGTDNWYYEISCNLFPNTQKNQICTHYNYAEVFNSNTNKGIIILSSGRYIRVRTATEDTIDNFKSWLSTHNTEVYYVIATPYKVDLGVVDMPLSYDEVTNIFTDSDLMPSINAKYYRNFITTIQNLQVNNKALKQELIDINTRLTALESTSASEISDTPTEEESEVSE